MKWLNWLMKAILLLFWTVLLINLAMPFPGKAAGAFQLLLWVMLATRGLQLLMLWAAYGKYFSMKAGEVLLLILFGVAGLDSLRNRLDAKQIEGFKKLKAAGGLRAGSWKLEAGRKTSSCKRQASSDLKD